MKPKRLTYKNNWESDEYYVGDKQIETLLAVKINDKEYEVRTQNITVPYHDMGHEYTATSPHYFVCEEVFGIKKWFDLNELVEKVKIYPSTFTIRDHK